VPLGSTSAGVATTGGNAAPAADLGSEFRAQLEASPAFARMRACLAKGSTPAKAGGGDTATMVEFIVAGDGSIANVHEPADVRDCIKNASRGFGFRSRAERANVEFAVIVPMTAR
jgi:hypothetical protein